MEKITHYCRNSSFRRFLLNQNRITILLGKPPCLSKSYFDLIKPWNQYHLFTTIPSTGVSRVFPNSRKLFFTNNSYNTIIRSLLTKRCLMNPSNRRSNVISTPYTHCFFNPSRVKENKSGKIQSALTSIKQHLRKDYDYFPKNNINWSSIYDKFFDQKYPNTSLKSYFLIKNPRISSTLSVGLAFLKQNQGNFLTSRSCQKMQARKISNGKLNVNFNKVQGQVSMNHRHISDTIRRGLFTDQCYSAQTWPKANYGPVEVFRSKFQNGMRIAASKPMGGQIAACTVMFRSGSRAESDDELGASHFVRAASGTSGLSYSGYIKTRFLQQYGGYISCSSDRQKVSFTLRCPPPFFGSLKYYLLDTATRCKYFNHELDRIARPIAMSDLARRPMDEHCLDLVQKACWTGGLTNSIYCSKSRINEIDEMTMQCYAARNFITSKCSVGSCGLEFKETVKFAELIQVPPVKRCDDRVEVPAVPRSGYEVYDYGPGDTYVCLAMPTAAGTRDLKLIYLYAILAETLGTVSIQLSNHQWDFVPSPPLGDMANAYSTYRAFHIAYEDVGLFGIMLKTTSEQAYNATQMLAEYMQRLSDITTDQIEIGKRRLMVALCIHSDDCVNVSEDLALQGMNGHQINNAQESMTYIAGVSANDVIGAAKQVQNARNQIAMAVVGDVNAVPDDLTLQLRS